jgi:hypothetical protein
VRRARGTASAWRVGRLAALIGLLAAAGTAAPAQGALRWSEPERLGPGTATNSHVAIDARGTVLATWGQSGLEGSGFTYRWRSPLGKWTAARTIPRFAATGGPRISMTPHGEALFAYSDMSNDVSYVTARAGGAFSEPKSLGEPGERGVLTFATDDVGNAVAAWVRASDSAIRLATKRPGLDFGPAQTIDVKPEGTFGSGWLSVAVNTAGAAVVAWSNHRQEADGSRTTTYRISYRPPAGTFGPPEDVPFGLRNGANQHVGLSETGEVVLAVQQQISDGSGGLTYAVRRLVGGWSQHRELGPLAFVRNVFTEPTGGVSFLMQKETGRRPMYPGDGALERWVQFATHRLDGTLAGPNQISAADGRLPAGAMNLRGDLLAAWGVGSGPNSGSAHVAVAERPAGGSFGVEQIVSEEQGVFAHDVALNDARQAAAIWTSSRDPGDGRPYPVDIALRFDPKLPPLPPPPEVDIGKPTDPILDENGIALPVECDQACTVEAGGLLLGSVSVEGRAKRGSKVRLEKERRGRVRVRFGAAAREAARKALAAGERPWVSVIVRAKGRSPRALFVSRRAKLR